MPGLSTPAATLVFKLLLPKEDRDRTYQMKNTQMLKLLSRILGSPLQAMVDYSNQCGEVSNTGLAELTNG